MIKKSPHDSRFVGDGYSFCVVNGILYHLYEDGSYDSSYPRLKVREAVEFMKKQLGPALRQRKVIDALKLKRDEYDLETDHISEGFNVKIAKLQKELGKLHEQQRKASDARVGGRNELLKKISEAVNDHSLVCSLRNKNGKSKISFTSGVDRVCVGCNELPIKLATKLALKLAKMK